MKLIKFNQKLINIALGFLIMTFLFIYFYSTYFVLKPLEESFNEGASRIEQLIKGQEDRTELLEEISLYREGLYALDLLLEARQKVISGYDEENPFLIFDYNQVLDDLRRLLPKDASVRTFQVTDKGLVTLPVESVDYASLGRVLRSFKNAALFKEVKIPSAVQRSPVQYRDENGLLRFKYVYTFVIQAVLDPIFWQYPLPFKDVSNQDYFAQAIRDLLIVNSVEGYADNLFRPHQPINRAEFYKLTLHALYANGTITLEEYSEAIDAPDAIWYEKYVQLADKKGVLFTNGADDPYHLDQTISRIEALQTVIKIFDLSIDSFTEVATEKLEKQDKKPAIVPFQDVGVKSEYYPIVHQAYILGLLHENSFYRFFEPKKPVSRAEVAYWVWKLQFAYLEKQ